MLVTCGGEGSGAFLPLAWAVSSADSLAEEKTVCAHILKPAAPTYSLIMEKDEDSPG